MKTVLKQTWTEILLSEVKEGDVIKFSADGESFTALGDAYLENGEPVVETVEDSVQGDDDGR
jgi:hypothetical protein